MSRFVVAVRAALPSPRPQGWQALQMAVGLAARGTPTTLVGDGPRPDGGPASLSAWLGHPLPPGLDVRVPAAPSSPPWAGVVFRQALRRAAGPDAVLLCRDPRVAAAQPRGRWRELVMEWHVRPDPAAHRAALSRADLHVTPAPGIAEDLVAAGIPAGRVLLLPNACGLDRTRAGARRRVVSGPVLAMGLHRRDGLDDALAAWRIAPDLPPLHIAGRDQGAARHGRWQKAAGDPRLAGRLRLLGPCWGGDREDLLDGVSVWLAAYPRDADTESRLCPLQVVDALGSGVPLVAPRLRSVVAAAGDAPVHLYVPGDAAGLAAAVRAALASPRVGAPELRPRWSDRAAALLHHLALRVAS
jgi:hypothetical protein